jgi:hypothetical protein
MTRQSEDTRRADTMACPGENQPYVTTYALHLPKQGATTEYHVRTVALTTRRKK